jgi:hypothetical protein
MALPRPWALVSLPSYVLQPEFPDHAIFAQDGSGTFTMSPNLLMQSLFTRFFSDVPSHSHTTFSLSLVSPPLEHPSAAHDGSEAQHSNTGGTGGFLFV